VLLLRKVRSYALLGFAKAHRDHVSDSVLHNVRFRVDQVGISIARRKCEAGMTAERVTSKTKAAELS